MGGNSILQLLGNSGYYNESIFGNIGNLHSCLLILGGGEVLKTQNSKKAVSDMKDVSLISYSYSIQAMKQDQIPEAVYIYDVENVLFLDIFFIY